MNDLERNASCGSTCTTPAHSADAHSAPAHRYSPATDVIETPDAIVLQVELPGVGHDQLDLSIHDGLLKVSGSVPAFDAGGRKKHLEEFVEKDYQRIFQMPDGVDGSKISADLNHGVLTVTLPKIEARKPRKIKVRGK